jgi:hypothetical protein
MDINQEIIKAFIGFMPTLFCSLIAKSLRRSKFMPLFGQYYAELSNRGNAYLTKFTAICPWCNSKMHLRHFGDKDSEHCDLLVCIRNPRQHTIDIDHTKLADIRD